MKLVRMNISIPGSFKPKLDAERKRGTSTAGLIRRLLEQHFRQQRSH